MAAKLTEVQSSDLHVAKKYFQKFSPWVDLSYHANLLLKIIDELTTDPPLPCGKCGKCLDCIRKERSHER